MLAVLIVLGGILFVMRPRRRTGSDAEQETLNPEVEAAPGGPVARPDADRLVGTPPVDTVSTSGEGTAVPGAGAGGRTSDARDALRSSSGDGDPTDQR